MIELNKNLIASVMSMIGQRDLALSLDYIADDYRVNGESRSLSSVMTTVRSTTAQRYSVSGAFETVAENSPVLAYHPVTHARRGLRNETGAASIIAGSATPVTQTVTVTATARTLSFYGTGKVVLSGTHAATVVGTGAFPSRAKYSFIPTAGSLTLTISGDVKFANLESGYFATSWIPTTTTQVARSADANSILGANFSEWFTSPGTLLVEYELVDLFNLSRVASINDGTASNYVEIRGGSGNPPSSAPSATGQVVAMRNSASIPVTSYEASPSILGSSRAFLCAVGFSESGGIRSALNGKSLRESARPVTIPNMTQLNFSTFGGGAQINGYIRRVAFVQRAMGWTGLIDISGME